MMKAVSDMIQKVEEKHVEFYAVEINSNILRILDKLDSMHVLKVMDHLMLLNAVEIYTDTYDKYVSTCKEVVEPIEFKYKRIADREKTNAYIINELRSRVKFPNVFREKRTIDTNKLRYGFGKTEIDVELVYSNQKNEAYVSCQFRNPTESIYQEVAKRKNSLEGKIGNVVVSDDENLRIVTFVNQFEHKFEKIDQLVDLMDKYIFYLSNITFYFGSDIQDQMWEQHQEGLLEI